MASERELLAQWAGEELFAAGRAEEGLRPVHRQRGEFYSAALDELRSCTTAPRAGQAEDPRPIGRLLAVAFSVPE